MENNNLTGPLPVTVSNLKKLEHLDLNANKITDIATAIAPKCETRVVGIRPGEKLHEEMITDTDSLNTIDLGKYYAILPSVSFTYTEEEYMKHHKAEMVPFGFTYNSGTNTEWETIDSLRELIKEHVDPQFSV